MQSTGPSVSEVVYRAEGKPDLGKPVNFDSEARCGNCRQATLVARAASVLTSQFGSWDDVVPDPRGGRWLCKACAWCYRATDLRRAPAVITQKPAAMSKPVNRTLRATLAGPIPSTTAVIIPLTGKRIVAPRARWGHVTTDFGPMIWRPPHHQMLTAVLRLRELGVGEKALADAAPPWGALRDLTSDEQEEARQLWGTLRAARDDKTLLPLLQRLGRGTA